LVIARAQKFSASVRSRAAVSNAARSRVASSQRVLPTPTSPVGFVRGRRSLAHISPDDGLSEPAQKNIYDVKETMNGYDSDVTLEREEDPRDVGDAYPRFLGHTFAVCDPDECVEEVEIDSEHVTNSITEKCDKKRCDLLAELWSVRNGSEIYNEYFPADKVNDWQKKGEQDTFGSNVRYAKNLKDNDYSLTVQYGCSQRTPGLGRVYAIAGNRRGAGGQQMLRRNVRVFLQHGVYYDYDMVAAWWCILLQLCESDAAAAAGEEVLEVHDDGGAHGDRRGRRGRHHGRRDGNRRRFLAERREFRAPVGELARVLVDVGLVAALLGFFQLVFELVDLLLQLLLILLVLTHDGWRARVDLEKFWWPGKKTRHATRRVDFWPMRRLEM